MFSQFQRKQEGMKSKHKEISPGKTNCKMTDIDPSKSIIKINGKNISIEESNSQTQNLNITQQLSKEHGTEHLNLKE